MVLSNKKLKQRLRESLTESLAASESGPNSSKPDSFKDLLVSAAPKPRLSKREKRRKTLPFQLSDNANGDKPLENKTEDGKLEDKEGNKKKKKNKRKRDELSSDEEVKAAQKPKAKKKKKKKKSKKAKSEGENKDIDGGSGEQMVTPTNDAISLSQANADVSTKVYVGGIPFYSTEDDIRSFFESCGGTITEVDCMRFPESGKFRGIAIISFKTEAAAKRALALDGADMGGLFLKIQPYKATRAAKPSNFAPEIVAGYSRIYVGNLSWDITEEEVRKFFSDFKISSVRFGVNKETGEFRGYAHVDFSSSLSVSLALKLDQNILCGRPVKISCAVPRKPGTALSRSETEVVRVAAEEDVVMGAEDEDVEETDTGVGAVSGKIRRRTCYLCGEKGHLSSECPAPKKGVSTPSMPTYQNPYMGAYEEAAKEVDTGLSGKMRRRTCYECGEKGHLSSECPAPKKGAVTPSVPSYKEEAYMGAYEEAAKEVDTGLSGKMRRRTCYECGEKGHLSSECPAPKKGAVTPSVPSYKEMAYMGAYEEAAKEVDTGLSGKIRRRTCYECGEKGHLSSECPAPKKGAVTPSVPSYKEEAYMGAYEETVKEADTGLSGKIRRRTCYECGEKGHLSSDCPAPKKGGIAPSTPTYKEAEKETIKETETEASSMSGKIRRRTCYECGEKGHLSSACPNKQNA